VSQNEPSRAAVGSNPSRSNSSENQSGRRFLNLRKVALKWAPEKPPTNKDRSLADKPLSKLRARGASRRRTDQAARPGDEAAQEETIVTRNINNDSMVPVTKEKPSEAKDKVH
jgi:hypothetical protein